MAPQQHDDDSSEESFDGFDSEQEAPTKKKSVALRKKDSEEEDLERLVLGNRDFFRNQLFWDDFALGDNNDDDDSTALVQASGETGHEAGHGTGQEKVADSALFFVDAPQAEAKALVPAGTAAQPHSTDGDAPAWEDSDDERLTVSLAGNTRLRKLRDTEADDVVTGTEYAQRLRRQYLRLYPAPSWVRDATSRGRRNMRRRRRSSAASRNSQSDGSFGPSDDDDNDEDGSNMLDESALPLEKFLRNAASFDGNGGGGGEVRKKRRPEIIDIQRTHDIPDAHGAAVSSLCFHPAHPVLLSSSTSSVMFLHHIAPDAHPTPNPMLTSVQAERTDVRRAQFSRPAGGEIVFAGRRPYFHSWDLASGVVRRISRIHGHQKEHRTMEAFRLSPCGRHMAIANSDRKAGGAVNVLSMETMQWIAQARVDGRGGVADLAWWSTGDGLTILTVDGQVGEWSMLTRRMVGIWKDEGSIGGTVIALGGHGGPDEIGADRWVAVGSKSGFANIYERRNLIKPLAHENGPGEIEIQPLPTPSRPIEQLVTAISFLQFSPDGQLLAVGSSHKKDALRLVHLPSCTVYRNWPTQQTPLGRISAVALGSIGGVDMLAVANDRGKIRLWEIRA